jgi:hypothetical protein
MANSISREQLTRAHSLYNPFILMAKWDVSSGEVKTAYSLVQCFKIKNDILTPISYDHLHKDKRIFEIPESCVKDENVIDNNCAKGCSLPPLELAFAASYTFDHLVESSLVDHVYQTCRRKIQQEENLEESPCATCMTRVCAQVNLRDYFIKLNVETEDQRYLKAAQVVDYCIRETIAQWSSRPNSRAPSTKPSSEEVTRGSSTTNLEVSQRSLSASPCSFMKV